MKIDIERLKTDAAYWRECGAPEDATHFSPAKTGFDPCWMKFDGEWRAKYIGSHQDKWGFDDPDDNPERYIPRPTKPAAPEWDGISAPAPGELAVTSGGECQVLGWDANRSEVAVQWYDGEMGVVRLAALKAIPTKAQRDRDELAELIDTHQIQQGSFCTPKNMADAIIAAGWQKP